MSHFIQRIIHVNPLTKESVTKTVVRKEPHTPQTLENYARQCRSANASSVNGRTKSGWPFMIENVGELTV
jgi:hypothetical protein